MTTSTIQIKLKDLRETLNKTKKKYITLDDGKKVLRIDVDKTQAKLDLFGNVLKGLDSTEVIVHGELVF